ELLHEVRLRVQPAGRVDDDDVAAAPRRALDRLIGDRRRVRPALAADERRLGAAGPDLELLFRGGAEGVGGREDDLVPVLAPPLGELADRPRLAGAGTADHE